jgi:RND family efflux transporter MFP subunit
LISPEVYYWETQVDSSKVEIEETKVALEKSQEDAELKAALTKSEAYLDFAEDKLAAAWYYYDHEYVKDKFVAYSSETGKKTYGAPNDAEVAEARAGLAQAKAALIEAQYYYSALIGEEVPEDATGSGLTTLEQTKLDLESAETDLAGASLVAPINGTIMSVDMTLGGTVESGTVVMTIADLSQQYLEVFLDESDWESIKVGYPTEVIFDILPDSNFTGSVVQIDPGLYTESGSSVVRTIVQLTNENNEDLNLPLGTSAAVDVIGGEATDAILIPIEALHDAGNGQYAVFVLTNGVPRLQLVEIGIKDLSSVEIKSGLNQGDVITTGIAETQ